MTTGHRACTVTPPMRPRAAENVLPVSGPACRRSQALIHEAGQGEEVVAVGHDCPNRMRTAPLRELCLDQTFLLRD